MERIPSRFTSEGQLLQTIDRIVSAVNRRVDEASPMVDARLPADADAAGARVNVVLPPLSLTGPAVTIRLFPKAYGLADLLQRGTLDRESAELLSTCVRARPEHRRVRRYRLGQDHHAQRAVPVHPGSGADRHRGGRRGAVAQPGMRPLETRPANVDGRGAVTIRELVRNALRMRPDRIVVGEVRGGEALDMLQAMNTGHEGR